jgi:ABC-type Fe3+ transport system permease subunit
VLTIMVWGLSVLIYPIFAIGCPGISLNMTGWTTVMVVICFFIALPSVPGFWGLWEAAGVFALALFGVAEKDALGFTLLNHAAQIFPVIAVGLASAWLTGINILRLSSNDSSQVNGHGRNE